MLSYVFPKSGYKPSPLHNETPFLSRMIVIYMLYEIFAHYLFGHTKSKLNVWTAYSSHQLYGKEYLNIFISNGFNVLF